MSEPTRRERDRWLDVAELAARRAGELIAGGWHGTRDVAEKRDADLVTDLDLACERLIREVLGAHCPEAKILGEEYGATPSADAGALWWLVDPVDGTTNLTHGFDQVAVSIALLDGGQPQVGVVYNPIRDQLFRATKGGGATLNGRTLAVSARSSVADAMVATGFPTTRRTTRQGDNVEAFVLMARVARALRRAGSAALDLAGVAAGWFDGYWEPGLSPWDTAAGWLLVTEAGGTVTTYDGGPFDVYGPEIVASNGLIHAELRGVVVGAEGR